MIQENRYLFLLMQIIPFLYITTHLIRAFAISTIDISLSHYNSPALPPSIQPPYHYYCSAITGNHLITSINYHRISIFHGCCHRSHHRLFIKIIIISSLLLPYIIINITTMVVSNNSMFILFK
jgi:hypothetical protein